MPTKRMIRAIKATKLELRIDLPIIKEVEAPVENKGQPYWDTVLPPFPPLMRFQHNGVMKIISPVTVVAVPYPGMGMNTFQCKQPGPQTSMFYWSSQDGASIVGKVNVGDQFELIKVDGSWVDVKRTRTMKCKKTRLDNVSIPVSKLLDAAKLDADTDKVLRRLVPEVFVGELVKPDWNQAKETSTVLNSDGITMLERRVGGIYDGHVWLNPDFEWDIDYDSANLILIATKKVNND